MTSRALAVCFVLGLAASLGAAGSEAAAQPAGPSGGGPGPIGTGMGSLGGQGFFAQGMTGPGMTGGWGMGPRMIYHGGPGMMAAMGRANDRIGP